MELTKRYLRKLLVFWLPGTLCFWLPGTLQARWEVSGALQGKQLQQEGFSTLENQLDSFFVTAVEQMVKLDSWVFEIRPELRFLISPALDTPPSDISRIAIIDQSRAMDLQTQIHPSKDTPRSQSLLVSDIEKLNLRFQGQSFEMTVGRNPFNPSILRLSPIWNKFSRDLFSQSYPNLQLNPDIATAKATWGNFWLQSANVFTRTQSKNSYLGIAGLNLESVELQILAGKLFDESTYGANANISTSESLIKFEILAIDAKNSLARHSQSAVAYETSWTDSLSSVSEIMSSSLPDQYENPKQISLGASPFLGLRSRTYLLNQLDYQFSETWTGSFTPIVNLEDSSSILGLSAKASLSDNFELQMNIRSGQGASGSEFSSRSIEYPDGRYLGYSNSASVLGKYFF